MLYEHPFDAKHPASGPGITWAEDVEREVKELLLMYGHVEFLGQAAEQWKLAKQILEGSQLYKD